MVIAEPATKIQWPWTEAVQTKPLDNSCTTTPTAFRVLMQHHDALGTASLWRLWRLCSTYHFLPSKSPSPTRIWQVTARSDRT